MCLLCSHPLGAGSVLPLLHTRAQTNKRTVCAERISRFHIRKELTPHQSPRMKVTQASTCPRQRGTAVLLGRGDVLLPEGTRDDTQAAEWNCRSHRTVWLMSVLRHTFIFNILLANTTLQTGSPIPLTSPSRRCHLRGHISNPLEMCSLSPQNSNFEGRALNLRRCG